MVFAPTSGVHSSASAFFITVTVGRVWRNRSRFPPCFPSEYMSKPLRTHATIAKVTVNSKNLAHRVSIPTEESFSINPVTKSNRPPPNACTPKATPIATPTTAGDVTKGMLLQILAVIMELDKPISMQVRPMRNTGTNANSRKATRYRVRLTTVKISRPPYLSMIAPRSGARRATSGIAPIIIPARLSE